MCLLKAASCINIPKYYLTQKFIHFPPPTEDYVITNTSFSCPNNDFKSDTNYQTPCRGNIFSVIHMYIDHFALGPRMTSYLGNNSVPNRQKNQMQPAVRNVISQRCRRLKERQVWNKRPGAAKRSRPHWRGKRKTQASSCSAPP